MPLAVKVDEVATPDASVVAVVLFCPLAKVPPAPAPGAVNVTTTPDIGELLVVTVAENVEGNGVFIDALWENGASDVTVVGAASIAVAGLDEQLVVKDRASSSIRAATPQYDLRIIVSLSL